MAREDIVAGLKSALAKGESLKQAMITFYNAGYNREDIQEAARALQSDQLTQGIVQPQIPIQPQQQPAQTQQQIQQPQAIQPQVQQPTQQRVSGYGKPKKTGRTLIITLVVVLSLLLGLLAVIFIFKDQLTDILNKLI